MDSKIEIICYREERGLISGEKHLSSSNGKTGVKVIFYFPKEKPRNEFVQRCTNRSTAELFHSLANIPNEHYKEIQRLIDEINAKARHK